ncbi:hypothetical protein LXL04_032516 [Taraxacum kok-saghyz]
MDRLKTNTVDLETFASIKVGTGVHTRFWLDKWLGNQILLDKFVRIFVLDLEPKLKVTVRNSRENMMVGLIREPRDGAPKEQLEELLLKIQNFTFRMLKTLGCGSWRHHESFFVSLVHFYLESLLMGSFGGPTRWNTLVPRKLNILLSRITKDRIPTRLNLRDKGIDLH